VLAQTTFDTTPYASRYLVFWVIVWMQDPQGRLVDEMPRHGLNSGKVPCPSSTQSPSCSAVNSLKDAHEISCGNDDKCFSNNVGFYKFPFYVHPAGSTALLESAPLPPGPVRLGPVQLSSDRVVRGQSVKVTTSVIAPGDAVPGATVRFYDGDPNDGGTLFDVERVAHIRANDDHHVGVLFRPKTCGFHSIFAVVGSGTPSEQVSQSPPLFLSCRRR
jgi:hypothetical protein